MFKKLFGGNGSKPPGSSYGGGGGAGPSTTSRSTVVTVDAIQKLGDTEELLTKRRDLLERKIAAELEKAKEFTRQKNKRAALMAMKKKKLYEGQLEQIENNILRVNEQQMMLESNRATAETISALSNAAKATKTTLQEMQIGDVDRVLDEIQDQTDQMRQIQDAMGQPLGAAADLDEDELLNELEELEASELDEQLLEPAPVPATRVPQAAAVPQLPSVPTTARPAAAKTPEELELEALQAEMAL